MLLKIKNVKNRVRALLEAHPHLRDDDNKLIANIWYQQLTDKEITAERFLMHFSDGKLANTEAIRRARQKLQEQHEHLRGKLYNERHKEKSNVKQGIHDV